MQIILQQGINGIRLPSHPLILNYSDNGDDTLGLLFFGSEFQHHIIQDEFRLIKVQKETRIGAGVYPLALRTEGSFHERFKQHKDFRIRKMHEGMIWLKEVPNFEYILYHPLNSDDDTDGCVGGGDTVNNNQIAPGFVGQSINAYVRTYPRLLEYVKTTKDPIMQIVDLQ